MSDRRSSPALRVGFILVELFTLNAFSGFIDALRLAADRGGRSRQIHCGWAIMGRECVTASCGLRVTPTAELMNPENFDYVAVCGGNGYLEGWQPDWLTNYLRQADAAGVPLIGVCTGTFNLARAGLMKGYTACVHWNVFDEFRKQFPTIDARPDRLFIDAGDRITCAGSAGSDDLALHLIARHCGHAKAQQATRHMMLQCIRPASYPQAHFYSDLDGVRDATVRSAVHLMEQTLNGPLPLPELARQAGVSLRQLERRFATAFSVSPAGYYRALRLRYGAWLLRHTTDTVTQIASDTGFADAAHFSREFRRAWQMTPSTFRRMTNGPGDSSDSRSWSTRSSTSPSTVRLSTPSLAQARRSPIWL
jgi:transcriptional regulator GlxA family with amidase domain